MRLSTSDKTTRRAETSEKLPLMNGERRLSVKLFRKEKNNLNSRLKAFNSLLYETLQSCWKVCLSEFYISSIISGTKEMLFEALFLLDHYSFCTKKVRCCQHALQNVYLPGTSASFHTAVHDDYVCEIYNVK
jgi:hypothetical protein